MVSNTEFRLDFKEISDFEAPKGHRFQSLIREILELLGYTVKPGGTGPDHGRDLFFSLSFEDQNLDTKHIEKWLVSCKDNSNAGSAIKREDFTTLYGDAFRHHCQGILIACTTRPTDDLILCLEGWATSDRPIKGTIWDASVIERILHENEEKCRLLLIRYFPNSYLRKGISSNKLFLVAIRMLEDVPDLRQRVKNAINVASGLEDIGSLFLLSQNIVHGVNDLQLLYPFLNNVQSIEDSYFQQSLSFLLCELVQFEYSDDVAGTLVENLGRGRNELEIISELSIASGELEQAEDGLRLWLDYEFSVDSLEEVASGTGRCVFFFNSELYRCEILAPIPVQSTALLLPDDEDTDDND